MRLFRRNHWFCVLPLLVVVAMITAGCDQRAADQVGDAAKEAAQQAEEAAETATQEAGDMAKQVADTLGEGYSSAVDKANSALAGVEGGGEILTKIQGIFASATESLKGVTDQASAEAAMPKLNELSSSVDGLQGMLDKLPAEAKTAVSGVIGQGMEGLKALAEKVLAIPGVGPVLKPTVDQLMSKLEAIAAK